MKKRLFVLLMAAVLLLSMAALGEESTARVFDYAGLFSSGEAEALEAAIIDFQENTGYDFAILINDVEHGDEDYKQLCDEFYATHSLGLGMNHTAILCYLDLYGDGNYWYYYIIPYGDLQYLMVIEDIQYLVNEAADYFNQSDFIGGFTWTMNMLSQALSEIGVINQTKRVFDYAEILSESDIETLEAAIAEFRTLSGMDFLYLSTYEEMDGNQEGDYKEEFFLAHGFGEGEERSGAMIYLDLFYGNFYVQNFGDMDTIVSQDSLNVIANNVRELMDEGKILSAALQILDNYAAYFK